MSTRYRIRKVVWQSQFVLSKYGFSQIPDITNPFGPLPPSTATTTTPVGLLNAANDRGTIKKIRGLCVTITMQSLYLLLFLVIVASVTTPSSLLVFGQQGMQSATTTELQQQPIIELSGQQYFANGTGIMYFSDNTTVPFTHSITPENGYYYDNSTLFLIGEIPGGVSAGPKDIASMMYTGTQVNITIPHGAKMLPDNQTFQPNVVRVNVGDLVTFVNNDFQVHRIVSPPHQGDINNANNTNTTTTMATTSVVPSGIIFDSIIGPGDSASIVFSSPGGFHFNDEFNENATGTLIVEEE